MISKEMARLLNLVPPIIVSIIGVNTSANTLSASLNVDPHTVSQILWSFVLIPLYVLNVHSLRQRVYLEDRRQTTRSSLLNDCATLAISMLSPILASAMLGAKLSNINNLDSVHPTPTPHIQDNPPSQPLLR